MRQLTSAETATRGMDLAITIRQKMIKKHKNVPAEKVRTAR